MKTEKDRPTEQQLLSIIDIQSIIVRLGLDLAGVMSLVAERTQELTGASGAVVEMVEGDEMVYRAATGSADGTLGLRLSKHTSLSGLCVKKRETLVCEDTETDPRVDHEACLRVGVSSMIVAPLFHGDDAVGVLKVLSRQRNAFDDADVAVLELMTKLIAASMYHATHTSSEALFHRATHDHLTGLPNQAQFLELLNRTVNEAEREGFQFAVLMIDLDGFKQINDTHGHATGDRVLREVANRMVSLVRQTDTVARLGGDEFGAILRTVADSDGAHIVVERMTEHASRPLELDERKLDVRLSIGLAMFPTDGKKPAGLIDAADQKMYAHKQRTKDPRA